MTAVDVSSQVSRRDDVLLEAEEIAAEARRRRLVLRLLGGTAIQLRGRGRLPAALRREPRDIDCLAARGAQPEVRELLAERGYRPDEAFNRLEGSRRLIFHDDDTGRQVDVFVGEFQMCHALPLADRLELEDLTLPLAELALTKLQIVELNDKDRIDLYALLAAHEVAERDGPCLNAARVAECCARDWGLWRTCTMNLGRLRDGLEGARLEAEVTRRLADRLEALERAVEAAPKSRRWRLRARLGDRVRWYETPDEIGEH